MNIYYPRKGSDFSADEKIGSPFNEYLLPQRKEVIFLPMKKSARRLMSIYYPKERK